MPPTHHLPDDLLVAYATGSSDDAEALFVASHLALCPPCRAAVDRLEALGGAWLDRGAPLDVEGLLDPLLARLDAPRPPAAPIPAPTRPDDLPAPLRALAGPLDRVPFRAVAPGIGRFDLPGSRRERPVALVSIRPGTWIPEHRHEGLERGLVLTGGYTADSGHFGRGDVEIRDPSDPAPHTQTVDAGAPCVVLIVDDGRKLPTSPLGKIVGWLFAR